MTDTCGSILQMSVLFSLRLFTVKIKKGDAVQLRYLLIEGCFYRLLLMNGTKKLQ